jgi:ribosomal protein S18 acetylase RimI-like enzyme
MPNLDSSEIELRYAKPADVEQLVALIEGAYRGDVSRAGWTTEADLLDGQRTDPEEIQSILENPQARLLLALRSGTLNGCVLLKDEREHAYIGMFAVRPGLQGQGMGKILLKNAEQRAMSEFGAKTARMTVIEQRTELIAWYERRGYHNTTRTEPFPYGDPRFGLPKRPDLRFVVLEKRLKA